jgi:hypothetical protein
LRIEEQVLKAFNQLNMGVICRIDGFLTPDNRVILHDPTTPRNVSYFVNIQTNGGDWIKRNRLDKLLNPTVSLGQNPFLKETHFIHAIIE